MITRPPRTVRPGWIARVTAPLAVADPALNRVADLGEGRRWLWLGLSPPDPRRPLPARAHVWIALTGLAGAAAVEVVQAATGTRSTGRTLAAERAWTLVVGLLVWAAATGAWERRAHRRRRRWAPAR